MGVDWLQCNLIPPTPCPSAAPRIVRPHRLQCPGEGRSWLSAVAIDLPDQHWTRWGSAWQDGVGNHFKRIRSISPRVFVFVLQGLYNVCVGVDGIAQGARLWSRVHAHCSWHTRACLLCSTVRVKDRNRRDAHATMTSPCLALPMPRHHHPARSMPPRLTPSYVGSDQSTCSVTGCPPALAKVIFNRSRNRGGGGWNQTSQKNDEYL